jgi:hypothetical protein
MKYFAMVVLFFFLVTANLIALYIFSTVSNEAEPECIQEEFAPDELRENYTLFHEKRI